MATIFIEMIILENSIHPSIYLFVFTFSIFNAPMFQMQYRPTILRG